MKPLRLMLVGIPSVFIGASALFAAIVGIRAATGNAPAQFLMGSAYQYALHDFAGAAKWYRASAMQGYASAELQLGNLQALSNDPAEQVKARYWLAQAAEQDNALAQFFLGNMELLGKGGPRDPVEGAKWTFLSLRHPTHLVSQYSGSALEMIEATLSKDAQKQAHDRVAAWQPKPRATPPDPPD